MEDREPYITGGKMREIKFRARRVDNGEWVYGQLVYMEEHIIKKWKKDKTGIPDKKITESICKIYAPTGLIKTVGLQQGQNGEPHKWKQDFIVYDVIPETIGQYTGLKDKNGKEIYCGDIICDAKQIDNEDYIPTVVKWVNTPYTAAFDFGHQPPCHLVEVIGNIYENAK